MRKLKHYRLGTARRGRLYRLRNYCRLVGDATSDLPFRFAAEMVIAQAMKSRMSVPRTIHVLSATARVRTTA